MRSDASLVIGLLTLGILILIPLRSGECQEPDGPSPCVSEVYPDLCPVKRTLYDTYLWYNAGTPYLKLSNAIANVGPWELFFEPTGPVKSDGTRDARQRVGCVKPWGDTLTRFYTVGNFEYHSAPCHEHIHLGKIAKYTLRQYVNDSVAGDTLVSGEKVGFCLVDTEPYVQDSCCGPVQGGSPPGKVFSGCEYEISDYFTEGISIGWQDVYGYFLADQWINISTITSPGKYFLQSVADPDKFIKQTTQANDTVRVPIFIAYKDAYEPNNSTAVVDAMAIGVTNSSNLKACQVSIDNLSVHREFTGSSECYGTGTPDVDYFKIRLTRDGVAGDSVRIRFSDLSGTAFKDGNLNTELLSSSGGFLLAGLPDSAGEKISLSGQTAGTYFIKVYGRVEIYFGTDRFNSHYYYKLELTLPPPPCGDVTGDGVVNSADVTALGLFCSQNTPLNCGGVADVDNTCGVNCLPGGDFTYLSAYVFLGGPPPDCNCQP